MPASKRHSGSSGNGSQLPLSHGAALLSILRIATVLSAAAAGIAVARLLGPEGKGQIAVAVAFFLILLETASLGIGTGATWLVGGRRWDPGDAFVSTRVVGLGLGCVAAIAGIVAHALLPETAFGGLRIRDIAPILVALPLGLVARYSAQVTLGAGWYAAHVAILGSQSAGYLIAVVVLAALFGLPGALVGFLVSYAVSFVIAERVARTRTWSGASDLHTNLVRLREAVSFGVRTHVANVLGLVTYRFDLFLISAYWGAAEVGYYAVAVALANVAWLIPSALSAVMLPRVSALSQEERDADARDEFETRTIRHTFVLVVVGTVFIGLVTPLVVDHIYGSRFSAAVEPTLLLLPGAAALGLASVFYSSLAGRGHPEYALRGALVVAPVAAILYVILVPPFGAVGAAIGSSASYAASALLAGLFLRRASGRPTFRRLVPTGREFRDYRVFTVWLRARAAGARSARQEPISRPRR